jgi:metal-responsive CopG/Arc/MetJ family transcriptional regulator
MSKVKATRIIISLPPELLEELSSYCEQNNYNRSECIRHAVRELIKKNESAK